MFYVAGFRTKLKLEKWEEREERQGYDDGGVAKSWSWRQQL